MKQAGKLSWFFRRLSVMSVPELAFRAFQYLSDKIDALRTGQSDTWPSEAARPELGELSLRDASARWFIPPCDPGEADQLQLLEGKLPVFGSWVRVQDDPAFWHTDPFTAVAWPRKPYRQIDYRPGNPTGDVRVVWELNRLQHLFGLALIAHRDEARRVMAIRVFESHLASWYMANPPGEGVNFISAMEEGLRVVALLHAWALIGDWVSADSRRRVANIVAHHARHIERRVSRFSSAGNHTIAEAVGLLYAGIGLRGHPRATAWQAAGLRFLRQEAPRQIDADGGSLEQATWYLLFVADLLGLAQRLLASAGKPGEPLLDVAVERAQQFLNALATAPLDLPRIGDADDGYALSPWLRISWHGRARARHHATWAANGVSLVRYGENDRLIFLHNPLGMAPGYAHGHADCLSLIFRWDGAEVLLDPGTYQYGADGDYRRYFRSTAAHNTASVGGTDQAEQLTAFLWRQPFHAELLFSQNEPGCTKLLASHDGYREKGVVHRRGVIYREGVFLAVWDDFGGPAPVDVALRWHLGSSPASLDQQRRQSELELPSGRRIRIEISDGALAHVRGSPNPVLGWRSRRYGHKEPCNVLEVRFQEVPAGPVLTVFWLGEPGRLSDVWPLCTPFSR